MHGTWVFTRPALKKWRRVRHDSTAEKQALTLFKAMYRKGQPPQGLVMDNTENVMALFDHSRRKGQIDSLEFTDNWNARNHLSFLRRPSEGWSGLRRVQVMGGMAGWPSDTLIGAQHPYIDNEQDLNNLHLLHEALTSKTKVTNVVNNLNMLISSLLGHGMAKKEETWNYDNKMEVTLEYDDVTIELREKYAGS
jgi:hypothetical protein